MTIVKNTGFTLIELMITLAIVTIIAVIAIPSYQSQMQKTRRTDAKATLMEIAQNLERCFTLNNSYDDASCTDFDGTDSSENFYDITVPIISTTAYTITATAKVPGPQDGDTDCRTLSLTQQGVKSSTNSGGTATTNCW